MPIIILTGFPCSGKTLRANQLEKYFKNEKNIETITISDSADVNKNILYADSQKEKISRSSLKSSVQRSIDKHKLIICDSHNYIKGFRYELFCVVKSAQTTKCLVYCQSIKEEVFSLNDKLPEAQKYNNEILEGLIQRYEYPDPNNKWDFPLFTVSLTATLPFEDIYDSLYKSKPLPPNLSTLPQALSSTNYLNELDSVTQDIVKEYIDAQRHCVPGEPVVLTVPQSTNQHEAAIFELVGDVPSSSILKLRRQFISYTRQHPPASEQTYLIRHLFIQFLKQRMDNN